MGLTSQFLTGQQAVVSSAAPFNNGTPTQFTSGIKVTCLSTSTAPAFLGLSDVTIATGDELTPGAAVILPIADISSLWVIAASDGTTTISWLGVY